MLGLLDAPLFTDGDPLRNLLAIAGVVVGGGLVLRAFDAAVNALQKMRAEKKGDGSAGGELGSVAQALGEAIGAKLTPVLARADEHAVLRERVTRLEQDVQDTRAAVQNHSIVLARQEGAESVRSGEFDPTDTGRRRRGG